MIIPRSPHAGQDQSEIVASGRVQSHVQIADQLASQLSVLCLQHDPQRHARMAHQVRAGSPKYFDAARPLSHAQLVDHLHGTQTYAAPLVTNDHTTFLALDIDSAAPDGRSAAQLIDDLLDAAVVRGFWAWGNFMASHQRGYVYLAMADMADMTRVRYLGDDLIRAIGLTPGQGCPIENRTHGADTRLPFGFHQTAKTFG